MRSGQKVVVSADQIAFVVDKMHSLEARFGTVPSENQTVRSPAPLAAVAPAAATENRTRDSRCDT